ncbi:MAG TPA: TonB-dependent receptor, partial [Allosphingosinicella sp.]
LQARLAAGNPRTNPYAAMPRGIGPALQDRSSSTAQTLDVDFVANGPVLELPAGEVSTTVRAGFQTGGFKSETIHAGIEQDRELARNGGNFQASLDIPIADRGRGVLAAIGDLSANLNLEAEHLSDVGTLRTIGGGLNWSPVDEIDFIASYTDEEGAPTVEQLGDPAVATPNFRVFDFITGETVEIIRIDGGNAALRPDRRRVLKLGATVKPFEKTGLSLTANYVRSHIRDVIAAFPTATPEIEAAFPERFLRSESGRLIRIDSRPVNFARSDREEMRWGLNFSKPLGPEPERPPGGWRPGGGAGGDEAARAARREARGSGRGRFGGGRFGGQGGRIQLAFYHTWRIRDEVLIRDGVPKLDFLNGSAAGNTGGRPAHQLELQAGLFRNGLGARLTADWQSGTVVRGGPAGPGGASGDLRFSDLATVNLRLFADLGRQRALAERFPWLRGTRVSLSVNNLFDARLGVRDATGATPLGYQPDYLDPLGRSVRITLRKLFF